jgi:hypothetical protein
MAPVLHDDKHSPHPVQVFGQISMPSRGDVAEPSAHPVKRLDKDVPVAPQTRSAVPLFKKSLRSRVMWKPLYNLVVALLALGKVQTKF